MSYNKAVSPAAEALEELLALDEILYSRTDKRGVILACNEPLRRISGHDWAALIGVPQRTLRSPDMPRAIFHLMWTTIQAGRPFCTVLQNLGSDGRRYWVLSVIAPTEGGYSSVHFRPAGGHFQRLKAMYAALLAEEKAEGLSPEASCNRLLAQLAKAGFDSYGEFATALMQESMAVRGTSGPDPNAAHLQALAALLANIRATRQEQQALMAEFDLLQAVPTNMRIIASRLEPSGGPISAISDNYKFASTDIARQLESFAGSESNLCRRMAEMTDDSILKSCIAQLLSALRQQALNQGTEFGSVDQTAELARISAAERQYADSARAALLTVGQVAGALNDASTEVRRMTLGLDTIRVMGKVESGHLGPGGGGLSSTIEQLDSRHAVIARHLQRLMDLSAGIKASIGSLSRGA